MRHRLALAVALFAAIPISARAQPVSSPAGSGPDTYLELHVGAFLPQADALDAVDAGWSAGGTFGARFTRWLGIEGEVSYLRASGRQGRIDTTFADVPFAASVRLRAPFRAVELSILGGAALHLVWLSQDALVVATPGATVPAVVRVHESATAFGFQAGAAVAFHLYPTMLVGAEARRTFLEPKLGDVRVRLDGLRVAITLGYQF